MRKYIILILLLFAPISKAQLWSGVISTNRAIDWTQAGLPGSALPDAGWTQCGATIAAYSGTGATITNQLATCGLNQYVLLGSGTFTLSTGIMFPKNTVGHLVLRGQGANFTTLNFTGTDCSDGGGFICAKSSDGTYAGNSQPLSTLHVVTVTSGATKGSTQLVLGSLDTIVVGSILVLDQCDTGFTGTGLGSACTGTPNDNGGYFHCQKAWSATNVGCSIYVEGGVNSWRSGSSEMEAAAVTAINSGGCGATCVTLSKPIEEPDWGSDTQAVIIQPLPYVGVENMTLVDAKSAAATSDNGVGFTSTYHAWVSGIAAVNMGRLGVHLYQSYGGLVKDSYFYGNPVPFGDHAGVRAVGGANNLIQNNICHKTRICFFTADAEPDQADIFAYNFSPVTADGSTPNAVLPWVDHGAGASFHLLEGNVVFDYIEDGDHGNHLSQTSFRNLFPGWMSCTNNRCGTNPDGSPQTLVYGNGNGASAIRLFYGSRYGNIVGNVLGTPGWSNVYKSFGLFDNGSIYVWGSGYGPQPSDPLVGTTTLLWGNYDVKTGDVRWCGNSSDTGWSTTCASTSEVPTGAPTYPNSVPTKGDTGGALPASFYLSSAPAWFGSIPWPPIGPDVSSGNVGQCAGALNTAGRFNGVAATSSSQCAGSALNAAWGGHVNANPAMACYLTTMGGLVDGTGGVLAFNPSACYSSVPSCVIVASPTSLSFGNQLINVASGTQTITVTNTSGSVNCTTVSVAMQTGTQFTQTNNCPATLNFGSNCTVTVTFKPTTVGLKSNTVVISSNVANVNVPVSGTGTDPSAINLINTANCTPQPLVLPGTCTISTAGSGHLLSLLLQSNNTYGAVTISGITDNKGNTWVHAVGALSTNSTGNTMSDFWYVASNVGGETTLTISTTGAAAWQGFGRMREISNVNTLDKTCAANNGSASATPSSCSVTTLVVNEFIDAGMNSQDTTTGGTGPCIFNGFAGNGWSYQIVSATGTYNCAFTTRTSQTFNSSVATYSAGGVVPPSQVVAPPSGVTVIPH